MFPAESSYSSQAIDRLEEMGVERRSGFQIEKSQLPRCAKVHILYNVDCDKYEWDDNCNVIGSGRYQCQASNDVE